MTLKRAVRKLNEKTDGYKFAVVFLAAIGSIVYVIFDYLQSVPVDPMLYNLIFAVLIIGLNSIFGILLYLLIKAYSLEAQDNFITKILNEFAPTLYTWSIGLVTLVIPMAILFIFMMYVPLFVEISVIVCGFVSVLILFLLIAAFFRSRSKKNYSSERLNSDKAILTHPTIIAFGYLIISCTCFTCTLFSLPTHGHVTIDMGSIHHKNDAQIPVLIQVTGPNTNLSATLCKEMSGELYNIDSIGHICPDLESEKLNIGSNNVLVCNYIGNGNYGVFINTTNLTTGYYELWLNRNVFHNESEAKSFYLLNES